MVIQVAILVTTFRRPSDLERLLESLRNVEEPRDVRVEVIVVDNDSAESARGVVERAASERTRWPIRYVCEPCTGIAHARNKAVVEAARADFIAFIDDDERALPRWLAELLRIQAATDADVVAGPVRPRFDDAPAWLVRSGLFNRSERADAHPISLFGAGNVLLRRKVLAELDPPFDPRFGVIGGEDTHLALRLGASGARMRWAAGAVVEERVPASRARAAWVLRRAFHTGATYSMAERAVGSRPGLRLIRAAKGLGRMFVGAALLLALALWGRAGVLRALHRIATGAGMLSGLVRSPRPAYGDTPSAL